MNIVEVLRQANGRRIKRKNWSNTIGEDEDGVLVWEHDVYFSPKPSDLTADDWEIAKQVHKIEATNMEFATRDEFGEVCIPCSGNSDDYVNYDEFSEKIPKRKPCKVTIEWEE